MATEIEKLVVALEARVAQYQRDLAQAQTVTQTKINAVEAKFVEAEKIISASMARAAASTATSMASMTAAMSAAGRASLAQSIANQRMVSGMGAVGVAAANAVRPVTDIAAGMASVGRVALAQSQINERLISGMSAFGGAAGIAANKIRVLPPALNQASKAASVANTSFSGVGVTLGGIGTYLAVSALTEYASAWTRVTRSVDAGERVFGTALKPAAELNDLANDARVDVEAYAKTYIRTAAAIRDYGYDSDTAAKVTSTLAKALKLGSASASEQASTILQFSQALQKGKLDGDEFRTVMENAGVIQELLAKRLNVTKGEIVKMAAAGQLQLPHLVGAMIDGGAQIERIFKQMPVTIDEAFSVMRNNVIRFVGEMDQAHGASQAVADGIVRISKNLDILAVAMGAILGSAAVRMSAFAAATVAAANPITLLAAVIGGATVAYAVFGDEIEVADGHVATLQSTMQALAEVVGGDVKSVVADLSLSMAALGEQIARQSDQVGVNRNLWLSWTKTVGLAVGRTLGGPLWRVGELAWDRYANHVLRRADEIKQAQLIAGKNFGEGLGNFLTGKLDYVPKPLDTDEETKRSKFDREIDQIRKRTEALRAELEVIGQTEFVQQKAKATAELRFALDQTAAKEKRALTAEELASIDQLSTAYASLGVKVAFLQKLQAVREGNEDLENEIRLTGLLGTELEKARTQQELLVAAKRAGVELTPDMEREIELLAERNAKLKEMQQIIAETRDTAREALSGFIKDMRDGTSATEALSNALNRISDKLIDMGANALVEAALGPLFGAGGATGGGGIIASLLGFAGGGKVSGPGTSTSDSIPARLSNGEYVVNADATRKFQPLLEAINSGKVPAFADGGPVNVPRVSIPTAVTGGGGAVSITVAPVFNVENGSPEGIDKMQAEVLPKIRDMVDQRVGQLFDRKARFARSGI